MFLKVNDEERYMYKQEGRERADTTADTTFDVCKAICAMGEEQAVRTLGIRHL